MKLISSYLLVLSIAISPAGIALAQQPADTPPATQPSGTWAASRYFTVIVGDDPAAVDRSINALHVRATRSVPAFPDAVTFQTGNTQRSMDRSVNLVINLAEAPEGTPRNAKEIADELIQSLENDLSTLAGEHLRMELERQERHLAVARQELEQLSQRLQEHQEKLRRPTGRVDASPQRVRAEIVRLEDARQQTELELEVKAARVEALAQSVAKLADEIEQKAQADPVAAELEKVVAAREAKAQRVKQNIDRGAATDAELQEALAEHAQARARLLERRAEAARAAGGDVLSAWNRELAELGVDAMELRVRRDALARRLEAFAQVMPDLDRIESLEGERTQAQHTVTVLTSELRQVSRRLAAMRPPRIIMRESSDRSDEPPPRRAKRESIDPGAYQRAPATFPE